MEQYWDEFDLEEIHFRDKWQFELKSHFKPSPKMLKHVYTQELYLYIPAALQVNPDTYGKDRFYQDKTNLIRYKTPEFTIQQIIDPEQNKSPLYIIKEELAHPITQNGNGTVKTIEKELKLLANIVRSTLRSELYTLLNILDQDELTENETLFSQPANTLLIHLDILLKDYDALAGRIKEIGSAELNQVYLYVADFLSVSTNYYLSPLLDKMRRQPQASFESIDTRICAILLKEKVWREKWLDEPPNLGGKTVDNETILYQIGLLNKYVIDALLLNTSVDPIDQRYRNIIGSIAAGVAMTLYILLFIWQGSVFVINSQPFILFTIFIYVLKDRLKDEIKNISMKQAFRWFSDYKTEIRTPDNKTVIGELRESFSYLNENEIPETIQQARTTERHRTLEAIRRQEQVMYYKKTVRLKNLSETKQDRFSGLNVIFRFDIHRFLNKASDSIQPFSTIDPKTFELVHTMLPKVYHLNIVLKNSYMKMDGSTHTEIKKYRIITNKEGILRVENLLD